MWIFIFLEVKISYLIYVLLKNSSFFWVIFTIFYTFLHNFIKKYKSLLKKGTKVVTENFKEIKSWRKILEELKQKIDVFIGARNLFNPSNFNSPFNPSFFVFCFWLQKRKGKGEKWKKGD